MRRIVACVVGTRPEAIKMAPVVACLKTSDWADCRVIATAQHRDLLDQALAPFGISADVDLDLMTEGQRLDALAGKMIPALGDAIRAMQPAAVLAQGDTATVFCASVAAYLCGVPLGHVEAGLRTRDLAEPFPEEGFRQMAARVARWHFAPTVGAAANLAAEAIAQSRIHVTGNTGIDALLATVGTGQAGLRVAPGPRRVLLTAHRRENFGEPMRGIFSAVRQLADAYPDIEVLYPVHPNPQVSRMAHALLDAHPGIKLLPPADYRQFTALMAGCHFVLTDSGGVQEEAPALGKPVLVLRDKTERPEAVDCGVARLVGTDPATILAECSRLLDDPSHYSAMASGASPYGDGKAAPRIVEILRRALAP
jgi:UDP-N-acetylglucosamine 2-epimerase (non-hydrolysing)